MLFSGIPFLFYFLPCVLLVYFIVPQKGRNAVLLAASLFFYGWGEPKFLLFMVFSIVQGYVFARLIGRGRRKKLFLTLSLVLSFALLGYCKYADFFIENFNAVTGLSLPLLKIALPIGISFYTFQIASYEIDVYRGDVAAQHNFIDFAAYVAMFPQLIAGPIVRYRDIAPQLKERTHSLEAAASGASRFAVGLGKKVLVANVLAQLVSAYKASAEQTALYAWLYTIAFTLQIYFDFSGYSDMAIGLGRIFGFSFPENFRYPYIAKSITEFWRRWHMSLGTWFRDLSLYPARRQPLLPHPAHFQHPRRLDGHRLLARRGVEFCFLGAFLCSAAHGGEVLPPSGAEKGESSSARLCASRRNARLCAL